MERWSLFTEILLQDRCLPWSFHIQASVEWIKESCTSNFKILDSGRMDLLIPNVMCCIFLNCKHWWITCNHFSFTDFHLFSCAWGISLVGEQFPCSSFVLRLISSSLDPSWIFKIGAYVQLVGYITWHISGSWLEGCLGCPVARSNRKYVFWDCSHIDFEICFPQTFVLKIQLHWQLKKADIKETWAFIIEKESPELCWISYWRCQLEPAGSWMETPAYSSPAHFGQESSRHLQALSCQVWFRPVASQQKLHESSSPVLKPTRPQNF